MLMYHNCFVYIYPLNSYRELNSFEEPCFTLVANITSLARELNPTGVGGHTEQVLEATLTKQPLYGHLPPIMKTIQVRRTRHAGHCWRSRDELISDGLLWTPSHGHAKAGWPARTSSVRIWGVALGTYRKWWMIGSGGKKGSAISMLMARQDDDDRCPVVVVVKDTRNPYGS